MQMLPTNAELEVLKLSTFREALAARGDNHRHHVYLVLRRYSGVRCSQMWSSGGYQWEAGDLQTSSRPPLEIRLWRFGLVFTFVLFCSDKSTILLRKLSVGVLFCSDKTRTQRVGILSR